MSGNGCGHGTLSCRSRRPVPLGFLPERNSLPGLVPLDLVYATCARSFRIDCNRLTVERSLCSVFVQLRDRCVIVRVGPPVACHSRGFIRQASPVIPMTIGPDAVVTGTSTGTGAPAGPGTDIRTGSRPARHG